MHQNKSNQLLSIISVILACSKGKTAGFASSMNQGKPELPKGQRKIVKAHTGVIVKTEKMWV